MATPAEVAAWMVAALEEHGFLSQKTAARAILGEFGEEHVYRNKNRHWAISGDVLEEFQKLTPDVVWQRGKRRWRKRTEQDPEGQREVR